MTSAPNGGVLCSGAVIYDTLVYPVDEAPWGTTTFVEMIEPHLGGNAGNTSIALAAIGIHVRVAAYVGRDEPGRFLIDRLQRAGVDTRAIVTVDARTAATIAIVNRAGNRKFLHRLGAHEIAFAEPIDFINGIAEGMAHYHLASLFLLPRLRAHASETLRRARAAGLSTSLDTNWDAEGRWLADLGPCLEHLDLLFINEDEARMTAGTSDPAVAGPFFVKRDVGTAIMKLGARGCAIYTRDGELSCPAFDVEAKDTTGAGDCFVAGFLAARLRGASLADAGHFANAVAALNVQQVGGSAGVRSSAEVQAWMRTAKLR